VGKRAWKRRLWLVPVVVTATAVAAFVLWPSPPSRPDGCTVTDGRSVTALDLAQAANAATIAGVAAREGLGDHAVTIALATAFQESKLHNVPYGDRDSVGLFQQRPSQGWGAPAQLLDPHYSAAAFYRHLAKVPGWRTMPVADAAQAVQRSAAGSAYADWEPAARLIARALTGEVPRGITCSYARPSSSSTGLAAALARDVGPLTAASQGQAGWRAASWLVAQSAQYSIETVTYGGQRWRRSTGSWAKANTGRGVSYTLSG
jgi:hypothetical protein